MFPVVGVATGQESLSAVVAVQPWVRDLDSLRMRAASNRGPRERIAMNRHTVSNALEMQREADDARYLGFQVYEDAAWIVA